MRSGRKAAVVCYCRVSSHKQRDDKDIGSGLNFKRKGLRTLLERLLRGDKLKVVVAHRDRLARFGFDLVGFLVEKNGGELVVLDPNLGSTESELTADLLAILHHFSCRMHGMRSHNRQENTAVSHSGTENDLQAMVRGFEIRLQQNRGMVERPEGIEADALDGGGETDIG
jgi:predicted site-specific integrase-resolvase